MELDQVVTWLKQQMIMRELRALAERPSLSQKRRWRARKRFICRMMRRRK